MSQATSRSLPVLTEKAIHDAGLDLIETSSDGAHIARISGTAAQAWISPAADGTWLAFPIPHGERFGLEQTDTHTVPSGMATIGKVRSNHALFTALHAACVLQLNTPSKLSERVIERLSAIAETERTEEVRQRIGQDVFREALFELWNGRCAVTGAKLPPSLLRASHAKPWKNANDTERLDPFNGLLLAVHLDALFDSGLLTFDDLGRGSLDSVVTRDVKRALGLHEPIQITGLAPGHLPYLAYHRRHVAITK